jgi:hypothetical protein
MTNTPNTNAQHQASTTLRQKPEWKKPMLDILSLEDAEHGGSSLHDVVGRHKSN